jgi:hypothetical protein
MGVAFSVLLPNEKKAVLLEDAQGFSQRLHREVRSDCGDLTPQDAKVCYLKRPVRIGEGIEPGILWDHPLGAF